MKLLKASACLLALTIGIAAQAEDIRVKTRLEAADILYEVDSDGDFKTVFEQEDGRTHLVFINSDTNEVRGMEIREVWAVAMQAERIPDDVAREMMRRNSEYVLGAWQLRNWSGRDTLIFAIPLSAVAPAKELANTASIVAQAADEVELELLGSDEL